MSPAVMPLLQLASQYWQAQQQKSDAKNQLPVDILQQHAASLGAPQMVNQTKQAINNIDNSNPIQYAPAIASLAAGMAADGGTSAEEAKRLAEAQAQRYQGGGMGGYYGGGR